MLRCLTPGCIHLARSRGVCSSCRKAITLLVNSGKTTMAILERQGRIRAAIKVNTREIAAYLLGVRLQRHGHGQDDY